MKKGSSSNNVYAVLYIDEHSVHSALVESSEPLSIFDTRVHTVSSLGSHDILLKKAVDDIKSFVVNRAKSGKISHLAGTLCVFGPSLYVCHIGSLRYAPGGQFDLNQKLLGDIMNSYREKNERSKVRSISITKMLLNGYEVSEISGTKGEDLEMHVCESEPLEEIARLATGAVSSLGGRLAIEPAAFIAFSVVRDVYPELNDFQVLVVGEKVSELLEVSHGTMSQLVSFPFGENHLVSYLTEKLKLSPHDIRTSIALLNSNALSHREASKLAKALEGAYASWGDFFKKGIAELSEKGALPSNLFLFSEVSQTRIWQAYFESNALLNSLVVGKLNVVSINAATLRSVVRSKTGKSVHPMLLAGAAHLFQERQFI